MVKFGGAVPGGGAVPAPPSDQADGDGYAGDIYVYARVSTKKQADGGLSIPGQLELCRARAAEEGWRVREEFVDAGKSGRTEHRPEFQRMVALALDAPAPVKAILVYSTSRFFRDAAESELLKRKLRRNGVVLRSVTQQLNEDPMTRFATRVMDLVDEEQSLRTSQDVTKGLYENARLGFHNGSRPPFGYRSVTVETRGVKQKKRLEIIEDQAAVVRLMYKMTLEGDGVSGPMGMKTLTVWLNNNGYRTGTGAKFYTNIVSRILHDQTYTGVMYYGRKDTATGEERPRETWVAVPVPPIIDAGLHLRMQNHIRDRHPQQTPPRVTNSRLMLGGIGRCRGCGRSLGLSTGKGRNGTIYRYYVCSQKLKEGVCDGGDPVKVPEAKLDKIVLDALNQHVLTPALVAQAVAQVVERRSSSQSHAVVSLERLRAEAAAVKRAETKLLQALMSDLITDNDVFRAQYSATTENREAINNLIALHEKTLASTVRPLVGDEASVLARELRAKVEAADPKLKRRFIRALVSEVFVSNESVSLCGANATVAEIASGTGVEQLVPSRPPVRVFAQDWCGWPGSNRHSSRNWILNPARLPIPPHPHRPSGSLGRPDR